MSRTIKNNIFFKGTELNSQKKISIKDFEKTTQITGKFCFCSHLHKNAGERLGYMLYLAE